MHHTVSGSGAGPSGARSAGRGGKGLRFMLVCLVFGVGFLCGVVAMWARPQATKSGSAVREAIRHAESDAHQHHGGFVKPIGIDHADHEGLVYAKKASAGKAPVDAAGTPVHHHQGDEGTRDDADHAASHGHGDHEHEHHREGDDHRAGDHDAEVQHLRHGSDSGTSTSSSAGAQAKDATDTEAEAAQRAKLLAAVPPDSIEAEAIKRAVGGTLFVIPVNDGYIDFGLNLLCSMERLGLFRGVSADGGVEAHGHDAEDGQSAAARHHHHQLGQGYIFVAMDELAYDKLQRMGLPVIKDPDVPFVSSKSAAWGDPKFHQLVCTKLIPVLRFLKAGLNVILSDADIVFRKDPYPFVRRDLGMTFTIGSCHKDLPDNFNLASNDGLAKLNTGFYHAVSSPGVISLLSRALENCKSSHLTGDQPAINTVLHDDQNKGLPGYTYGFFDGCLFANGCIYFKHLCANTSMADPRPAIAAGHGKDTATKKVASHKIKQAGDALPPGHIRRDDPVMVHANFLVGKKDKVKHLRRYGLWADACIALWRGNVTEPPTAAGAGVRGASGGSAGLSEAKAAVKKSTRRAEEDV